ncbi:hypothetical protein C8R43DRAFT_1031215 [Mycena crocata]|nr:hypothetical protein C8R43DRAFT_1031215 [Mycena crocata]
MQHTVPNLAGFPSPTAVTPCTQCPDLQAKIDNILYLHASQLRRMETLYETVTAGLEARCKGVEKERDELQARIGPLESSVREKDANLQIAATTALQWRDAALLAAGGASYFSHLPTPALGPSWDSGNHLPDLLAPHLPQERPIAMHEADLAAASPPHKRRRVDAVGTPVSENSSIFAPALPQNANGPRNSTIPRPFGALLPSILLENTPDSEFHLPHFLHLIAAYESRGPAHRRTRINDAFGVRMPSIVLFPEAHVDFELPTFERPEFRWAGHESDGDPPLSSRKSGVERLAYTPDATGTLFINYVPRGEGKQ